MTKFASITASLLARKGEASPWDDSSRTARPHIEPEQFRDFTRREPAWRMEAPPPPEPVIRPMPPEHSAAPAPENSKRCTVRLSPRDYERLGIMAVKQDVTRQQFLQSALSRVLDELAREFPGGCACIGENCGQGCSGC